MVITGAFDGTLSGGTPKLVEVYVINDIPDLSLYGFGSANNGGGTDGEELTFAGSATAGDYIYIASEGSNPGALNTYFGITADYLDSSANVNGDDALELFFNGSVIDTFGDINTDGTGENWEYLDGWAYRVDGTGPDGASFTFANWTFSGPNAIDNCSDNASCSSVFPIGTYTTVANTNPTITITAPANNDDLSPGTTSVNVEWTTANLAGGETVNITVNGTTTNNVTSPFAVATADGETYNITVELIDGDVLDSDMVSFEVLAVTTVNDVASLRAGTPGNTYQLTGEVLITYLTSFRNQKHIQDATGGILIDDSSGIITSPYALADGITGLIGTLGEFNNTLQFVPIEDPGTPSSTGNVLTPEVVSFTDLNANPENYESELVQVIGVDFDNTDTNFNNGLEIAMTQGPDMFNFRTAFNEDYSNGTIPAVSTDVTGIILDRSGNYFLMARYASDFSEDVLSVNQFETTAFSMYPNPTNVGFVNITSNQSEAMTVQVYDILGKQVKNQTVANNRLDVSDLVSGIYIVKLTQNGASTTKKLVIR